ncbi:MAG: Gmad2 immunoglobulin-like domain-containing protein [bacterium]|nr:Gmad2 immunoglobulin-like domain-containing protein [bacterium]
MKKTIILLIVIFIVIYGFGLFIGDRNNGDEVQVYYSPESARELIEISRPAPGSAISSPLKITGKARGNWYFEATFPVVLVDWDGLIIAEGYATAKDEWMTTDFVPFEATLEFTKPEDRGPQSVRSSLILQRSNPSGLPENAAALEIPITFK